MIKPGDCEWCGNTVGEDAVEIPELVFCNPGCREAWSQAHKRILCSAITGSRELLLMATLLCGRR